MRIETLDVDQAIAEGIKLPFVFLRNLSSIYVGETISEMEQSEILEARYFSVDKEIRIIRNENGLSAVSIEMEIDDTIIHKRYKIQNSDYGKEIMIAIHLDYDEDGQAYVRTKRLEDWRR